MIRERMPEKMLLLHTSKGYIDKAQLVQALQGFPQKMPQVQTCGVVW